MIDYESAQIQYRCNFSPKLKCISTLFTSGSCFNGKFYIYRYLYCRHCIMHAVFRISFTTTTYLNPTDNKSSMCCKIGSCEIYPINKKVPEPYIMSHWLADTTNPKTANEICPFNHVNIVILICYSS